jgi:hypothetical protein
MKTLSLTILPERFVVFRLPLQEEIPEPSHPTAFWSATRTKNELSVVALDGTEPEGYQAEKGWRCLQVVGLLDFNLTGVLASLAVPLADSGISIFAISTYETDYLFIKEGDLKPAIVALQSVGHQFQ